MPLSKGLKEKSKKYLKNWGQDNQMNKEFTGQAKQKNNFNLSGHFCRLKIQSLRENQKLQLKLQILPQVPGEHVTQLQRA